MEPAAASAAPAAAATDEDESLRLALALQKEEMGELHQQLAAVPQPDFGAAADDGVDDETRQTLELAWRLQQEEQDRVEQHQREQREAAERMQQEPEDNESLALAIRLQQEDDEQALRSALGVLGGGDDDEPGSPSGYSYEQLMRLTETVGTVSKGASSEAINALRTMSFEQAQADPDVLVDEQV